MADRLIRNTAILVKTETTPGTDAAPTGSANALQVSKLSINPINANNVNRDLIRAYLGSSEQLVGTRYVEMGFDVELVGSGTVGTAPAWGPVATACGMGETLTATRADYTPVSTGFKAVSIWWYDDGILHKSTYSRGNVVFKLNQAGIPVMSFKFFGLYTTPTAASLPAVDYTAFKTPEVVTNANSGAVTIGGTHATTGAPVITGGTAYPSQGLEIDMGLSVNYTPLLGGETIDITGREPKGSITLDVTAAQEVALMADVEAATTRSVGLRHGTAANQRVMLWLPKVQFVNPTKAEANGKRLVTFEMRALPVAGNDEVRLVTSF